MTRDEAVAAIMATGKTRDQAEAFLAIMGSGFRRRGWVEGQPLSDEEISDSLRVFVGNEDAS